MQFNSLEEKMKREKSVSVPFAKGGLALAMMSLDDTTEEQRKEISKMNFPIVTGEEYLFERHKEHSDFLDIKEDACETDRGTQYPGTEQRLPSIPYINAINL